MNLPVENRHTLIVIFTVLKGTPSIHFCDPRLSGGDSNLWMPVNVPDTSMVVAADKIQRSHLHAAIEQIMLINNVAHNVVRVEEIKRDKGHHDYRVTYNELT